MSTMSTIRDGVVWSDSEQFPAFQTDKDGTVVIYLLLCTQEANLFASRRFATPPEKSPTNPAKEDLASTEC